VHEADIHAIVSRRMQAGPQEGPSSFTFDLGNFPAIGAFPSLRSSLTRYRRDCVAHVAVAQFSVTMMVDENAPSAATRLNSLER